MGRGGGYVLNHEREEEKQRYTYFKGRGVLFNHRGRQNLQHSEVFLQTLPQMELQNLGEILRTTT